MDLVEKKMQQTWEKEKVEKVLKNGNGNSMKDDAGSEFKADEEEDYSKEIASAVAFILEEATTTRNVQVLEQEESFRSKTAAEANLNSETNKKKSKKLNKKKSSHFSVPALRRPSTASSISRNTGIRPSSSKKKKKSSPLAVFSQEEQESIGNDMFTTSLMKVTKEEEDVIESINQKESISNTSENSSENAQSQEDMKATEQQDNEVSQSVTNGENSIKGVKTPVPLCKNPSQLDINLYLARVNKYITSLGYHYHGEPAIRIITSLSLRHHNETARQLIKAGDRIKCLHALILGIYFTNCTPIVERFPINFKSKFNGKEYRHVVLGIFLYGSYGALGISRDPKLQEKQPCYPRLSDLLIDYVEAYNASGHTLMEVKVGGIISRDATSQSTIPWKLGPIFVMSKFETIQNFAVEVDKLARLLKVQMGHACIRHVRSPEAAIPIFDKFDEMIKLPKDNTDTEQSKSKHKKQTSASSSISYLRSNVISKSKSVSSSIGGSTSSKKPKKKISKHKRFLEP